MWNGLPVIRREIAESMINDYKLNQKQAAERLGVLFLKPANSDRWKGPYLKKQISKDTWGVPFVYRSPGLHNNDYDLESNGPNKITGGGDDITNWEELK